MGVVGGGSQKLDPERQMEYLRRFLRGENVQEYRNNIKLIVFAIERALNEVELDKVKISELENDFARLRELLSKKLAGEKINPEEIDPDDIQEEELPDRPDKIEEPDELIKKIEDELGLATIYLTYPETIIGSEEEAKKVIKKIKERIEQAKEEKIDVKAQEKKLAGLIQKYSDVLGAI